MQLEDVVAGRYELLEPLDGSSAWFARDRTDGREVALREVRGTRARRLAEAAMDLDHPNLVPVLAVVDDRGASWQVTDVVAGTSLEAMLEHGPLPVPQAVRMARQVLAAVAHAHRHRVVPGSVTARDVLVGDDGKVRLAGLGSASPGSAACLPPERAAGEEPQPAGDLYSVGCLLWWAIAGHPPFESTDAGEVARMHRTEPVPSIKGERLDVPDGLLHVLAIALDKDPGRRFSSAEDMDAALAATGLNLEHDGTPVLPPVRVATTPAVDETRVVRTRTADTAVAVEDWWTTGWFYAGVGILLSALLVGLLIWASRPDEPSPTPTPPPVETVVVTAPPAVVQQPAAPPAVVQQPAPPPVVVVQPAPGQSVTPAPATTPAPVVTAAPGLTPPP